ncbi:hypothetical protein AB0O34_07025 [Sphaerisporangium sp. NPDC088356]
MADRATFGEPLLPPAGIGAVIVGGQIVVRDGTRTTARPGTVLTT